MLSACLEAASIRLLVRISQCKAGPRAEEEHAPCLNTFDCALLPQRFCKLGAHTFQAVEWLYLTHRIPGMRLLGNAVSQSVDLARIQPVGTTRFKKPGSEDDEPVTISYPEIKLPGFSLLAGIALMEFLYAPYALTCSLGASVNLVRLLSRDCQVRG